MTGTLTTVQPVVSSTTSEWSDDVVLVTAGDVGDGLREAFERVGVDAALAVVTTVESAVEYLSACREGTPGSCPRLVVLDRDAPDLDAVTVLEWIRDDPVLAGLPVCVLGRSTAPSVIRESYAETANAYLPRPDSREAFESVARAIGSFWLETAEVPTLPTTHRSR